MHQDGLRWHVFAITAPEAQSGGPFIDFSPNRPQRGFRRMHSLWIAFDFCAAFLPARACDRVKPLREIFYRLYSCGFLRLFHCAVWVGFSQRMLICARNKTRRASAGNTRTALTKPKVRLSVMANANPSTPIRLSPYQEITNRIVAQLESGTAPWHKPWRTYAGQPTAPRNLLSQKPYRGINALLTAMSPYASPFWLTFKQAKDLGGHVNAGEKSTPVVFWKFGQEETEDQPGENTTKTWAVCRLYHVFNFEQVTIPGLKLDTGATADKTFNPIPECEGIVAGFNGPTIAHGGDRAYYSPAADAVQMPNRAAFDSAEAYYGTLFHELSHATGHRSRLNRDGINAPHFFGDAVYSKEELVAEMGAAFLSGHCGIEARTIENSASYCQSWVRVLKGDARLVLVAAGHAQKAADLILGAAAGEPK